MTRGIFASDSVQTLRDAPSRCAVHDIAIDGSAPRAQFAKALSQPNDSRHAGLRACRGTHIVTAAPFLEMSAERLMREAEMYLLFIDHRAGLLTPEICAILPLCLQKLLWHTHRTLLTPWIVEFLPRRTSNKFRHCTKAL